MKPAHALIPCEMTFWIRLLYVMDKVSILLPQLVKASLRRTLARIFSLANSRSTCSWNVKVESNITPRIRTKFFFGNLVLGMEVVCTGGIWCCNVG